MMGSLEQNIKMKMGVKTINEQIFRMLQDYELS